MVMGKGGVGKTTIAASIALGLVQRVIPCISAHRSRGPSSETLAGEVPGLRVDRIDPKAETNATSRNNEDRGRGLDAQGQALLREDLRSPCTKSRRLHAFARIVAEARGASWCSTPRRLPHLAAHGRNWRLSSADTRQTDSYPTTGRIITPLMRLQDSGLYARAISYPGRNHPCVQASALQDDLRRAHIEPYAWVINKSLLAAGTRDPFLRQRLLGERRQIDRVCGSMAKRVFFVPWQATPPIGLPALQELAHPRPQRHRTIKPHVTTAFWRVPELRYARN